MPNVLLSAREIYHIAPLGSLLRFSDGTPEPPARDRRKRTAWLSNTGAGRLVQKKPADHLSGPSFALHVGNFGSGDVTVVEAYRIITMASPLSYAILERPRSGQAAVLQDASGIRKASEYTRFLANVPSLGHLIAETVSSLASGHKGRELEPTA